MAWPTDPRPARALTVLKQQVDDLVPGRSTSSDGMIASTQHHVQNPTSDHEPNKDDVVTAIDLTHDPRHGFDSYKFAEEIRDRQDPRIRYTISNKKITGNAEFIKSNPGYGIKTPWAWGKYTGENDHSEHVHISLVRDPALYDNEAPFNLTLFDTTPTPTADLVPPLLVRGSTGLDVKDLQTRLGVDVDGDFGPKTEAAVKAFQKANGLVVDGRVGPATWKVLRASAVPVPTPAPQPIGLDKQIETLVEQSSLKNVVWKDRGKAPIGYLKGMALTYADCLRYPDDYVKEMMKPPQGDSTDRDALVWYHEQFKAKGLLQNILRNLFTLMIGLGMRESSGNYREGRDMSASNVTSNTAEAGLFQQSWDSSTSTPLLPKLLKTWPKDSDGREDVFAEGLNTPNTKDYGSGDGLKFQELCKDKPEFAVYAAGVGLRNIRKHWGPINRREVEIRKEADDLLKQVQSLVQGGS